MVWHNMCWSESSTNLFQMFRLVLFVISLFPGVVVAQLSTGGLLQDLPLQYMQGGATSTHALFGDQGAAFVFWSNDCNWTLQYEDRVEALNSPSIPVILVNSNNASVFPNEAEAGKQYEIAYVRDSGGGLAHTLGAERTPHVFVFDSSRRMVYSGGIDDSPADAQLVQSQWLRDTIAQLSGGQEVTIPSTKSFGCRIKLP